jgi:hypothetical protein
MTVEGGDGWIGIRRLVEEIQVGSL